MSKELSLFDASISGISLVEAGAGTGKTYNITSLFVRVILEKKLSPANILVLTYTEAATAELKNRLRGRIKESISALEGEEVDDEFLLDLSKRFDRSHIQILKKALYQFDEAAVSTIHGFCQRLLKENSMVFGVSPKFEILSDDRSLLQEVVDHFWRNFLKSNTTDFRKALVNFIVESGYFPDNLMERVKAIIDKPYAILIPESKPLSSFEKDFDELKEAFNIAKKAFLEEQKEIESILNSDSLNGNKYKNREKHFEEIKNWFNTNEFPIKPVDRLYLFSSFMREDGKKKGKEIPELKTFKIVDEYLELSESFSEIEVSWLTNASIEIRTAFEQTKEGQDLLTYNDLLIQVEKGLEKNDGFVEQLNKKYPVALIDEFQDTDPVQYSIFQKVYSRSPDSALFMIGDPKQAIYSFRGADIYTYIEAREQANSNQKYSLSNNYRSSKKLIECVNKVFEKVKNPFLIENLPFKSALFPEGKDTSELLFKEEGRELNPLQFIEIEVEGLTADGVRKNITESTCTEILKLLSGDFKVNDLPIQESDIAVLVRTHYQAQEIQNRLRGSGVKCIVNSKESVFLSKEASELYLILSAILNPSFEDGVRAALTTEALGFSSEDIQHLLKSESEWEGVFQKFLNLNKLWKEKGFLRMSSRLLKEFGVEFNYAKFFDAERRITNTYHIFELLDKAERLNHFSINGLKNFFKIKRNEESNNNSDEEIVRLESDERLVQIVTMHASKGLEYPIVLCPYLWEGITVKEVPTFSFHKRKQAFLDIGSKNDQRIHHKEAKLNEELAERVRLCYVALTRAKVACFVFVVDGSDSELSPFSALFEGNESIKQRIYDQLSLSTAKYKSIHKNGKTKLSTLIRSFCDDTKMMDFRKPYTQISNYLKTDESEENEFKTLSFSRSDLFQFQKITSFSSLSQSSKQNPVFEEKAGFDYDDFNQAPQSEENSNISILSIQKGAKTGTLLHEIFEEIYFNDPRTFDVVISKSILKHGFSDVWKPVLQKLVRQTVDHRLKDEICLADLSANDCLIEMEFHFPISSIELSSLMSIIRGGEENKVGSSISGFMKGFIDLVFVKNGKYYILDYKSNFLGDSISDYDNASIKEEILHSKYDLQYHIYVLALHKMLERSVPNYSYEEHFGGVMYLFLRGIDPSKKGSGVYFDKPEFSLIQALSSSIKRGGRD
ncbi:MAG: exodeoxyribonuclease V subunit beta [Balneolaceae bacterium]